MLTARHRFAKTGHTPREPEGTRAETVELAVHVDADGVEEVEVFHWIGDMLNERSMLDPAPAGSQEAQARIDAKAAALAADGYTREDADIQHLGEES